MSEITKELFYSIITNEDKVIKIDSRESYTDVMFCKHGVKLVRRTQNSYANYYIEDINK